MLILWQIPGGAALRRKNLEESKKKKVEDKK
jgi:hypothetical protein